MAKAGHLKRELSLGVAILAGTLLAACVSTQAVRAPTPRIAVTPRPAAPQIVDGGERLQCVPYARRITGIEIYGDAYTWWAQADGRYARANQPVPGSALVLRVYADSPRGHIAVVRNILSAREILVDHANWMGRGEISVNVPVQDISPNNDWSAVHVWNIAAGQWGIKTYPVEGFILPQQPVPVPDGPVLASQPTTPQAAPPRMMAMETQPPSPPSAPQNPPNLEQPELVGAPLFAPPPPPETPPELVGAPLIIAEQPY